jgi:CRISPR-associated endonuclease Csn1
LRKKKEVSFNAAIKNWDNIVDKQFRKIVKNSLQNGITVDELIKQFKKEPYVVNDRKVEKIEVYYLDSDVSATRKSLDITFNEKIIESTTDTGIQKILLNHHSSEKYQNQTDNAGKFISPQELAFSPEGIEELNQNIEQLNNGKRHKPIYKVRKYEALGKKFPIGETGNKQSKYVVAATGTNLFYAVYEGKNEKDKIVRQFNTIPLNEVLPQMKDGSNPIPNKYFDNKRNEYPLLFSLSPNDLVYLPSQEEMLIPSLVDFKSLNREQQSRIYLFVDGSGTTANFIPSSSATVIFNLNKKEQAKINLNYPIQNEFGVGSPQSKNQKSIDGGMIKESCWKLEVDRIGNIFRSSNTN